MADKQPFNGYASLGSVLLAELLDCVKAQRTMWAVTPQQQQQETIDYLAEKVDAAVRKGMKEAMAAGHPSVIAKIKKIDIDVDGTTARLEFSNAELHALTDYVGADVVLVLCDPETHTAGVMSFKADADQAGLPLE